MSSDCINCGTVVEPTRGDDGHFRKRCTECGHVGGPYVSETTTDPNTTPAREQASLDSFT